MARLAPVYVVVLYCFTCALAVAQTEPRPTAAAVCNVHEFAEGFHKLDIRLSSGARREALFLLELEAVLPKRKPRTYCHREQRYAARNYKQPLPDICSRHGNCSPG